MLYVIHIYIYMLRDVMMDMLWQHIATLQGFIEWPTVFAGIPSRNPGMSVAHPPRYGHFSMATSSIMDGIFHCHGWLPVDLWTQDLGWWQILIVRELKQDLGWWSSKKTLLHKKKGEGLPCRDYNPSRPCWRPVTNRSNRHIDMVVDENHCSLLNMN